MQQAEAKKIIIIGSAHPLRGGGLATFNHRLCKALLAANYNASIISFSLQYPAFLFPGTSQFTTEPAPINISIKSIINAINPFNWVKVGLYIRKQKPDIIIVRYWLPFMGPCLGSILRFAHKTTKIICIADNIIPHEKRFGDKIFTKYFVKPVDAFVTMSDSVSKDLALFNKKNKPAIQLAHPLYDNFGPLVTTAIAKQQAGFLATDKIMLFFGFIRKYKGLNLLVKAMANHAIKNANIKLIIAGEFYEDENYYKQLITDTGNSNHIFLHHNFIPDSEVGNYFNAADVIIQPYKNATQSGVTPLAYYFEKPTIVTNVGGLPQMAPHGLAGLVCEPSVPAIEEAILNFFNSDINKYKTYLLAQKKLLSWENFVGQLLEV